MKVRTIYTAGYKQRPEFPPCPVNIARWVPRYFPTHGLDLPVLAPDDEVWRLRCTPAYYRNAYYAQIDMAWAHGRLHTIIDVLPDGAVLMCWEKDHVRCHRYLAAQYLALRFSDIEYGGEWWALENAGSVV